MPAKNKPLGKALTAFSVLQVLWTEKGKKNHKKRKSLRATCMPHDPGEGFGQAVESRHKASVHHGCTKLRPETWATKMLWTTRVPHVSSCLFNIYSKPLKQLVGWYWQIYTAPCLCHAPVTVVAWDTSCMRTSRWSRSKASRRCCCEQLKACGKTCCPGEMSHTGVSH